MNSRALLAAAALALFAANPARADQHALVVGINEYAAFQPYSAGMPRGQPYDLLGARNDAETVATALRAAGVELAEDRVLMDEGATVQAFLDAFERLKAAADPGDTLIVTFAGHGAQEREASEPYDEDDGLDEIIMFHDFDPSRPGTGRLSDDELRTLMQGASEYQVVWVFDSCHAGGLVRSAAFTVSRFGGIFDGLPDPSLANVPPTPDSESFEGLPHLTQILATASEVLRINETEIDGKMHGALSWYFAEALSGAADTDGDNALSRGELASFLEQRVFARMNQSQQPRLFPEGDDQRVLSLTAARDTRPQAPRAPERVSVNFLGALPPGLDPEKITRVPTGAVLTFEEQGAGLWDVYNHTGDRITSVSASTGENRSDDWPKEADALVARAIGLATLDSLTVASEPPVSITAQHGNGTLSLGQEASFDFVPPSEAKPYLTLFNVAANGNIQPLFPERPGGGLVASEGISATFAVVPPTGADQLYAVACPEPAEDLHRALQAGAGKRIDPALTDTIRGRDCQVGSIGLYTQN
ncbi:caspase family protein [Allosediminivita pacifica]|uniref:Caspase domain-containing protein n=1 Tax=Allosediminivita pacifica TaxID=1267769 RepID=A0A2T6B5V2_9RHOB|nr:caspase family protein [Allosediminivita pacifica]PTX51422.1 caspase domain-containing protein [Allosediminivita pacifica]